MLDNTETQLVHRCAGHLSKLAQVCRLVGADDHQIVRDLKVLESIARKGGDSTQESPAQPNCEIKAHRAPRADASWADDIVVAYTRLGSRAQHASLYRKVKEVRIRACRSWPFEAEATIRQVLQAHNAESPQYRGDRDLFRMERRGLWRLK